MNNDLYFWDHGASEKQLKNKRNHASILFRTYPRDDEGDESRDDRHHEGDETVAVVLDSERHRDGARHVHQGGEGRRQLRHSDQRDPEGQDGRVEVAKLQHVESQDAKVEGYFVARVVKLQKKNVPQVSNDKNNKWQG